MSRSSKVLLGLFAAVMVFAIVVIIIAAVENAETDRFIEDVDLFLAQYEERNNPEPTYITEPQVARMAAEPKIQYTWNQEMIGKVVAFEVGNCGCYQCWFLVASACLNRFYEWYDRDVIAMISDRNDEYYMMNPEYIYADEMNDFNFWEHYEEIMAVVADATETPAVCYYWDCDDTQRGWAELIYHCPEDGCWFYR